VKRHSTDYWEKTLAVYITRIYKENLQINKKKAKKKAGKGNK
jgi:hypothetical protein